MRWVEVDLGKDNPAALDAVIAGADVVIHLAWLFQPARDPDVRAVAPADAATPPLTRKVPGGRARGGKRRG